MHRVIRFVVEAKTKQEALEMAASELESLQESNTVDYGHLFDDDAATSRWGKMPAAARLDSKAGATLLLGGLQADYTSFMRNMQEITSQPWRYWMKWAGEAEFVYCEGDACVGSDLFSFSSIRSTDPHEVWVVPCDVHT